MLKAGKYTHTRTRTYVCMSAKSSYITRYSSKTKVDDAACFLFYSSKIFVLDVFSSFLNSFGVVIFCDLEEEFKVKWYLLSIHLFTISLDKVCYSHFCFLRNASNRQIDLSSLVTSYMGQKRVLIRSLLLLISAPTLGKGRPRGEYFHFWSLTVSSTNDSMQEPYS